MQARSTSSLLLIYIGAAATALSVVVLGLTAVVKASTGWSQASPREKTVLELQVESSREIRRALATPVVTPPLPPITARPARDMRETVAVQEKKPARVEAAASGDERHGDGPERRVPVRRAELRGS